MKDLKAAVNFGLAKIKMDNIKENRKKSCRSARQWPRCANGSTQPGQERA